MVTENIKILWVDDEINLLKPHIIFLEQKGYSVSTSNNGDDALDILDKEPFDIIFLDEQMPGLSGIETLEIIKNKFPNLPVVMITKSEEESIMEDAIGSKIADYLIKPVNPNQILLCLKKNLENKKLQSDKATHSYQQQFRNIGMDISGNLNPEEWIEVYKKIVRWEIDLGKSADQGILEVLKMQKEEANQVFGKFIERNYESWIKGESQSRPIMSPSIFKDLVFPFQNDNKPLFFILIDNY